MEDYKCVCENSSCLIPFGTCHCGCGAKTTISNQTKSDPKAKFGWPRLYLKGHSNRATWDESICVCGRPDCAIPFGTCHCGCGGKTRIASMTQSSKRWRRDEPMPYLEGHWIRGKTPAKKGPNEIKREVIDGIPCVWLRLRHEKWTVLWEEDYEKVKPYRWWYQKGGYAYTTLPNGKSVGMHRIIISPDTNLVPDHEHGDRLDNRRDKLRPATIRQNHFNRAVNKTSQTGWSGIDQMKSKKFRSRINVDRQEIHLGVFDRKEDAIKVRMMAEEEHFGEFRRKK